MDRDKKRKSEEDELDAEKPTKPENSADNEITPVESTPRADDEMAGQIGDAASDATDESDDSAAIEAELENEVGRVDLAETARTSVEVEPADKPSVAAEAPTASDEAFGTAEPAVDAVPAPAVEDTASAPSSAVVAAPTPSANGPEFSSDASFVTADVASTEVDDPPQQRPSQTFVTPPFGNSLVVDAASFSPPDFGTSVGDSDHVPDVSESFSAPRAKDAHVIDDLVLRSGDHGSMERLPYIPGREPDGPKLIYLGDAPNSSSDQSTAALPSQSTPSEPVSSSATDDGGSALTCPVVLVEVPDAESRRVIEEALTAAAASDAKTLSEIAKEEVEDAFWVRACHERAVYRD